MQISRNILCLGEVQRHSPFYPSVNWKRTAPSFGAQIPSGAAVMIVTPDICHNDTFWEKAAKFALPRGFRPLMGWADDATAPGKIEVYVQDQYGGRSNARVQYHGMSLRVIDRSLARVGPVDSFFWFGNELGIESPKSRGIGYYLTVLPKSKWKKFESVSRYVENLGDLAELPAEQARILLGQYPGFAERFYLFLNGSSVSLDSGFNSDKLSTAPVGKEFHNRIHSYPLIKSSDGYVYRETERDYLVFYPRTADVKYEDRTMPTRGPTEEITVKFGEKRLQVRLANVSPAVLFDPDTQNILIIRQELIGFPATP